MNASWLRVAVAAAAGLSCGAGLVMSGMAQPQNVLRFLDVLGEWDASLLLVMGAAVFVFAATYALLRRRRAPVLSPTFSQAPKPIIDGRLIVGATVFGVGWGISGLCPGPSLVALGSGSLGSMLFVLCFLVGSYAVRWVEETTLQDNES